VTCPMCDQSVAHLPGSLPNRYLTVLSEAPFAAPSWCPPEVWSRLDAAIVDVLKHRPRAA
jgi:hypothetical protein